MLIANARHFLDDNGAIAPPSGPARKLAEFLGAVIAYATHPDVDTHYSLKCRKRKCIGEIIALDDGSGPITWHCTQCDEAGTISDWQETLWDLRALPAPTAAN